MTTVDQATELRELCAPPPVTILIVKRQRAVSTGVFWLIVLLMLLGLSVVGMWTVLGMVAGWVR